MPKAYAVAIVDITDPEGYQPYEKQFLDILSGFDAKLLGLGQPPDVIEGEFDKTRMVIVEFSSKEEFHRWYQSEPYQEILKERLKSSIGSVYLVPGFA